MAQSRYRYIFAHLGAPLTKIAEIPVYDVQYQRLLNAAGTFSGKIKMPVISRTIENDNVVVDEENKVLANLYKEATDRGTTCVFILRDNTPMGCWIIWSRTYDIDTQTITLGGAELPSYWTRRIVEDSDDIDNVIEFENTPMFDIASNLIGRINDIGLTLDIPSGQGPNISRIFRGTDVKIVSDVIKEFSEQSDGFDYRIDIEIDGNTFNRILRVRSSLGNTIELTAKYATNINGLTLDERGDLRANDYIVVGGQEGPKRPFGRDTTFTFVPPLQSVESLSDIEDTDVLEGVAIASREAFENHQVIDVSLLPNIDSLLGTYNPGDLLRLSVPPDVDPWFQGGVDQIIRTIGYEVSVPDTQGEESIGLVLEESDA